MEIKFFTYLFIYFTLSSGVRFLWTLLSSTFSSKHLAEESIQSIVRYGSMIDLIHLGVAFILFKQDISCNLPDFIFEGFAFDIYWDIKSLIFMTFSIIIISLINQFSTVYLLRDPFYFKFFSMIYLLQLALVMLILTQGDETIFIGWEFLGLSSVLLIAFYEYRASVLKNSLIILAIYKTSDLFLYGALLYSASQGVHYYHLIHNPYCVCAILFACLIKSSIIPWYWLPRAVEGPTQSTAVFYGSLATHIPVYILMRVWDFHAFNGNYILFTIIVALIVVSIITTNILSRIANDAKNAIAYATITQLGIIYLEVLFGLTLLATVHCIVHGLYRTMEFLRSPSILYEHQLMEQGNGEVKITPQGHLFDFIPRNIQNWVYNLAYNEFIFSRVLMGGVESFMGIFSSRINSSVVKTYLVYSSLMLLCIELIAYLTGRSELSFSDQLILLLAYALNILALLNKYRPWAFFISLAASVFVSLIILTNKLYPITTWFSIIGLMLVVSFSVLAYRRRKQLRPTVNFIGQMHRSSGLNFLLLMVGLSIIGMPGLGIFYIWSRLEHALMSAYPNLLLLVYALLTLNTIVFFRFYYINFLGKHDTLKQIKAVHS